MKEDGTKEEWLEKCNMAGFKYGDHKPTNVGDH